MSRIFREAFSLESADGALPEGTEAEVALESEVAANEIMEADREVEMAELQEDELADAEESLESIVMSLESLIEKDPRGLDRVAAEGYHHAVRAIVGTALDNPVASLESFGSSTECQHATELSLEGIKDTLKKIWEAIKRAVRNAIRAVSDFFAKLFGGVSKLKDRAKKALEKAEGLKKDGATAEGSVDIPNADRMALGGKISLDIMVKGLHLVNTEVASLNDELQGLAESYYSDLVAVYTKTNSDPDLDEVIAKGESRITKTTQKLVGRELPGGRAFGADVSTAEGEAKKLTVRLVDYNRKVNFDGQSSIDLPKIDLVISFLKALIGTIEGLEKKKTKRENLKKAREKAVEAGEKLVKDADSGKVEKYWNQTKISVGLRLANRDMNSIVARVDNYVFSYCRSAVAAASAMLDKYKKPKAA